MKFSFKSNSNQGANEYFTKQLIKTPYNCYQTDMNFQDKIEAYI